MSKGIDFREYDKIKKDCTYYKVEDPYYAIPLYNCQKHDKMLVVSGFNCDNCLEYTKKQCVERTLTKEQQEMLFDLSEDGLIVNEDIYKKVEELFELFEEVE